MVKSFAVADVDTVGAAGDGDGLGLGGWGCWARGFYVVGYSHDETDA